MGFLKLSKEKRKKMRRSLLYSFVMKDHEILSLMWKIYHLQEFLSETYKRTGELLEISREKESVVYFLTDWFHDNSSNLEDPVPIVNSWVKEEISNKPGKLTEANPIIHHLCLAYCLRALCIEECHPSKTSAGDMAHSPLSESIMYLLHYLSIFYN